MKKDIEAILEKITSGAGARATAFAIGNTSDLFSLAEKRMYEIPIRETSECKYGGVIVRDVETAEQVARLVDGKVDYLFVDDEKKIRKIYYGANDAGNIEKSVRAIVRKSSLITYKGNDLAVEAVDALLASTLGEVSGARVAVIGLGNLGSKIALKLVERGVNVTAFRRDQENLQTIIAGLNKVKSVHTLSVITACERIEDACRQADVVIGTTNEKGVITREMIAPAQPTALLIDAGKGCFADEVTADTTRLVYRIDISMIQKNLFTALIQMNQHYAKPLGRHILPELQTTLISLGLFATKDEVIVDDIHAPTRIIGISAGDGTLMPRSPELEKRIEEIQGFLHLS